MNLATNAVVFRRVASYLGEHGPTDTAKLAAAARTSRYSMSGILCFHLRAGRVRRVRPATLGRKARPAVWELVPATE